MNDAQMPNIESLVGQYADGVWRYVYAAVKHHDIADDITQEVFIQAHLHLSQFRRESSIKTWLFTIARNKCNDYYRSALFRRMIPTSQLPTSSTTKSAEEEVLLREDYSQLVQWILSLPRHQREILILRIQEDMTFSEIARVAGIKESTARIRYKRAIEKLKVTYRKETRLHGVQGEY